MDNTMKTASMKVELVDHMGSDLSVVNAARVSFEKHHDEFMESDHGLVRYLAAHNHWTPFGHAFVTFRIKAPIFVARQLVKHQVGLVWNEVSRRYVDSDPEYFQVLWWRSRPEENMKQGSGGTLPVEVQQKVDRIFWDAVAHADAAYKQMLELNVSPEQARAVLPLDHMTEWYWSGSLAACARVCKLRLDPHAQAETSEIAQAMDGYMASLFPVAWKELMK